MPTIDVQIQRISVVSSRPFEEIVDSLTATIGRPDMNAFHKAIVAATTAAELEAVVRASIGSSDLMEFVRFDAGEVLRKERGAHGPKILRLVVGNPLIMKEMAKTVPDAASYAPITILVDERADGVHLSYDSLASLMAPYRSESAHAVATDLDAKIQSLIETAAGGTMALSDEPVEGTLVSCDVCHREIPKSDARAPEAVEYFVYFCGPDCFDKWTNLGRPSAEQVERTK